MNVGPVRVDQSADRARVSADLRMAGDTRELWFEIRGNAPYRTNGTEVDAFAVAAWLIAMDRAEPEAVLDGAVSPTLVHNLSHQAAPILRLAVPTFGRAVLRAPVRGESPPPATGVATGFSGGIDSFCTIADYLVDDPLPSYRLSHLVFSNVGANGRGSGGAHLFSKRWELIQGVAAQLGLAWLTVDSNLDDFIETRFERTHVPRNAVVALLLQAIVARYLYSSTYRYPDCYLGETDDLGHADPALVHLFSTESLELVSTGCQYSRVEKTRRAALVPQARSVLNVCVNPDHASGRNCSRCFKCLRTLTTLELIGELDGFKDVFDVAAYKAGSARTRYLAMLPARSRDAFIKEILELAQARRERLPAPVRAFHRAWPLVRWPYEALRGLKHAVTR